ncbi:hypothetical protein E2C01_034064 [Portunus trituberculatus]|uniref:Uncharacterized protein n=1 Tax=Portunus trituberculatus TaxID=210409 RepID=A0A5B7F7I1_PORTR|nr:hypothetical protein [Portunus trituberculatus]
MLLPLQQHTATVPSASSTTMPQPRGTQELPATNSIQHLTAVVNVLAAKVDNLSEMVSALSNQFATFKKQQKKKKKTVPGGTSLVALTPCPISDTKQDQVCVTHPRQRTIRTAGQCVGAAAPSPKKAFPTKPVQGATRQPRGALGMAHVSPASEDKSPEADCDRDTTGEWTLVTRRKRRCSSPLPVQTASPKLNQGYVISALQTLVEQMSHLTQDVDDLKTQVQHHHSEW